MVESIEERGLGREYKKLQNCVKKLMPITQYVSIMDFLIAPDDETRQKLQAYQKAMTIIEEFQVIHDTVKKMEGLTREQGYDKMCIEQDLMGSCDTCEYNDICCTSFGKTIR